jgi:hypothetical protein
MSGSRKMQVEPNSDRNIYYSSKVALVDLGRRYHEAQAKKNPEELHSVVEEAWRIAAAPYMRRAKKYADLANKIGAPDIMTGSLSAAMVGGAISGGIYEKMPGPLAFIPLVIGVAAFVVTGGGCLAFRAYSAICESNAKSVSPDKALESARAAFYREDTNALFQSLTGGDSAMDSFGIVPEDRGPQSSPASQPAPRSADLG